MAEHADACAEDGPDGPEVPGAGGEPDGEPHREHDDDHREVTGQMDLDASACRCPACLSPLRVVAAQLGQRQVGDELTQFGGGGDGERGL
jgi:hypothetical protein